MTTTADKIRALWVASGSGDPKRSIVQLEKEAWGSILGLTAVQMAKLSLADMRRSFAIVAGAPYNDPKLSQIDAWLLVLASQPQITNATNKSYNDYWADYVGVM